MRRTVSRSLHPELILLPLILIAVILSSTSCEKDDICVEGETPLLAISFFDQADSSTVKSVPGLRIIAQGQAEPPDTFTDRGDLSAVSIPLNVSRDTTVYLLIRDSADEEGIEIGNIDTVRIMYTVDPTFVSRACGFVAEFDSLQIEVVSDDNPWILGAEFTDTRLSFTEIESLLNVYF